jgi:homoserine O-acetyltransferase
MPESTAFRLPERAAPPPAPAVVSHGLLGIPNFRFHADGRQERVVVAWRLVGPGGAPVVAALGGISAGREACDPDDPARGWWRELAGPGLPLDTCRFAVLAIDWLGGAGASTAPGPAQDGFPAVDARDQARALLAVCDRLRIERLHAAVGASYGGMVALGLAEIAPARVGSVLAIGTSHRGNALSAGWRGIQRAIVRHGLALGDGAGALALARSLAMTTYRTRAEFERRFAPGASAGSSAVVQYLLARGQAYAGTTRPESFLCLSESIDRFRLDPARVRVPAHLVAIVEDQLVTLEEVRELASSLAGPVVLHEFHSEYGHDAFLKERDLLAPAFRAALEGETT